MGSKNNEVKLTIYINGKEIDNTLQKIGSEIGKINRDLRTMNREDPEFKKKVAELQKAKQAYSELKSEINGASGFFDKLTKSVGGFLAVIGVVSGIQAFINLLSKAYTIVKNFDSAQSELASILGKSKVEIVGLTALTLKLGATTAFTATQATQAATELAKLGLTQKEIGESLKGIINGALALGSEIPETAELVAATLKAFNLEAKDTDRVVSTLAAGANATSLGFESLKTSLGNVAPAAAAANYTVEQTVALLGLITDTGIDASTAGTSLRNMFIQLSTKGITLDDALNQIANSQNQLTKATEIFDVRSAVSALALANQKDKINELTEALTDQKKILDEMAHTRMDNLEGSVTLFKSAWEGLILSIENGNGVISKGIRKIFDFGTSILNFLNPQKTAIEQTKEEQFELNKLVAEITSTNIKVEDRKKLINELQDKYPGFLENLDKEKVTNEELRDKLYEVNDAYIKKLALQKTEEKYKGILEDQSDLISKQAENQRKLFDNLNQSVLELSRKGVKLPPVDMSDLEGSYTKIQVALRNMQKQLGEINGAKFGGLIEVNSQLLGDVQNINAKLKEQTTKVELAKRQFEFEANVVKSTVGIVDDLKNSVSKVKEETNEAAGAANNLKTAWSGITIPNFDAGTLGGLNDILKDYNSQLLKVPIGSQDEKILKELIKQTENKIAEANGTAEENRKRKAEEAAKNAAQKRKQQADKVRQERKKYQEESLKAEEQFHKTFTDSERKSQDAILDLMNDGFAKEKAKLDMEYIRKKEDLNKEIKEIDKLSKEYTQKSIQSGNLGDSKTAAKFKLYADKQKEIIREKNLTIQALEVSHGYKVNKLEFEFKQKELQLIEKSNQQELNALKIKHNEELASITSLESAKSLLQDHLSEEELKRITTMSEAKKALTLKQNAEINEVELKQLQSLQEKLEAELLNNKINEDSGLGSLFTEEQKNALIDRLREVKLAISDVNRAVAGDKQQTAEEKNSKDKEATNKMLSGIDILGLSAEQWETAFENLKKAEGALQTWAAKIDLVSMSVQTLQNAWTMMYEAQATASQRAIQQYEAETARKKEALKNQLDQGYINQSQYDAKVKKLEADMEARRANMEYKTAMKKYHLDIANALSNTALGVTRALASTAPPYSFVLASLVSAMGALQLGIITDNKPVRGSYAKGGVTSGLGFKDETGEEVAGVAHAGEYYIPRWLRKDPEVAQMESYIEYKRKGGNKTYAEGRSTTPQVYSSVPQSSQENNTTNALLINLLNENIIVLKELKNKGVIAWISSDVKNMQKYKEAMKKSDEIINNGKIIK